MVDFWLSLNTATRIFVGFALIFAGLSKLNARAAFRLTVIDLNLAPRQLSKIIANTLPWLEISAGMGLVAGWFEIVLLPLAVLLLTTFVVVSAIIVLQKRQVRCNCFGTFSIVSDSLDARALTRNVGFLAILLLSGLPEFLFPDAPRATPGSRYSAVILVASLTSALILLSRTMVMRSSGRRSAPGQQSPQARESCHSTTLG